MKLTNATEQDLPFIAELLTLSNNRDQYSRGFPRGDLNMLQYWFDHEKLDFLTHLKIITEQGMNIGIVGNYGASYLIGPVLTPNFHDSSHLAQALKLAKQDLKGPITLDVLENNQALIEAFKNLNLESYCDDMTMSYALSQGEKTPVGEMNQNHFQRLNDTYQLFMTELEEDFEGASLEDFKEYIEDGHQLGYLIVDEQVVGAAIWDWEEEFLKGHVHYICVSKNAQRKGYGTQLLNHIVSQLPSSGTLYLDLDQSNKEAFKFYENYGFQLEYLHRYYELGPQASA